MTVCVGAFAAESKAIVMVADKAITYSSNGPALMQWDTCVKKIIPIGPFGWRALIAGDPNFAQEVVRITVEALTTQPDDARSPWKVMERMKLAYQQLRETRLTDTLLIPKLLTKELLVARHKDYAPLDQNLIDDTTDEIAAFQIDCHMLVCGFDDLGDPHMFLIADPGIAQNYDAIGFHATGIGADVALGRLLWDEVSPKDDLEKVLYHAFEAKANAEIVSGVGYEWDAEILISGNRVHTVPDKIKKIMDQLFATNTAGPFGSVDDEDVAPATWKSILKKYSVAVLAGNGDAFAPNRKKKK